MFDSNTFLLGLGQQKALYVQQQQISVADSWIASFLENFHLVTYSFVY